MNRTQKSAVINLSGFLVNVAVFGYLFIRVFVLESLPQRSDAGAWLLAFAALHGGLSWFAEGKACPSPRRTSETRRS